MVIVRLLNQLLKRFKNLSSDPIMFKVYDRIEVAITKWKSSFQSRTSIIDTHDPIATNPDSRNYFFNILDYVEYNIKVTQ